jgi:hypothetical protein
VSAAIYFIIFCLTVSCLEILKHTRLYLFFLYGYETWLLAVREECGGVENIWTVEREFSRLEKIVY